MIFYRHLNPEETFSPNEHLFLVEVNGEFLFPMKDTDCWTTMPASYMRSFQKVKRDKVPADVRRKAGQRLGARNRHQSK